MCGSLALLGMTPIPILSVTRRRPAVVVVQLLPVAGVAGLQALAVTRAPAVVRLEAPISSAIRGLGHIIFGAADVPFRQAIAIGHHSSQLGVRSELSIPVPTEVQQCVPL